MKTFFRVDEWYKNGSGSRFYFEQTETESLAHAVGMERVSITETDNEEHTTITAFKADSCDMEGWSEAVDSETTANPAYFKY